MRPLLIGMLLLAFLSVSAFAQEVADPDGKAIAEEVRVMMNSFNEGNADDLLEKVHPAIYKITGGEKNFKVLLRTATKQIVDSGVKVESLKVEAPKDYHQAGQELVCFVPMLVVMEVDGTRVKSTSFMIAARRGNEDWRYLDGAGLIENPGLLWILFPELDQDVDLPENRMEVLDPDAEQAGLAPPVPSQEPPLEGD